jgi:DNA-binding NtrC family response regulator
MVFSILHVPPLRQRREDVVELAEHFLARHRGLRRLTLLESADDALRNHEWPGNVRELQRVVERALALTTDDVVDLQDLPAELSRDYVEVLQPSVARAESMRAWGSRYARLMLERCGHNKRRTCEVLGISYHTLQSYLRESPGDTGKRPAGPAAPSSTTAVPERKVGGTTTRLDPSQVP